MQAAGTAAPIPTGVFKTFEQRTGVAILEGYGLTEAACVSTVNPARGERRLGSVGLRLPYQEVRAALVAGGRVVRLCEAEQPSFARSQIGERAAVPKTIHILEQIPLTLVGKVFKRALGEYTVVYELVIDGEAQ